MSNNLRTRNGMPFNFVNGLKVRGMDIESLIPGIEGIPEAGSKYQFAGNGSVKSFTLPVTPYNKDAVDVYVKQLYVHPDDYTLVGDTVTLVEAPPAVVAGETYNVVVKVSLTTLNGYVNANRVSFEGENLDDILEKSKPLANYSNLRAYAGAATQVRITDPGIAGFFYYDATDTTSTDNDGTIIVSSNGKRWKRITSKIINVRHYGAIGDGVTNDAPAFQKAVNFAVFSGISKIFIPFSNAEKYRLSSTVTILSGDFAITGDHSPIRGSSLNSYIFGDEGVDALFDFGGGQNHAFVGAFIVDGISLYGKINNDTGDYNKQPRGIKTTQTNNGPTRHILFKNVTVKNFYDAFYFDNPGAGTLAGSTVVFDNCYSRNHWNSMAYANKTILGVRLVGALAEAGSQLKGSWASGVTITDSQIEGSINSYSITPPAAAHLIFQNNSLELNRGEYLINFSPSIVGSKITIGDNFYGALPSTWNIDDFFYIGGIALPVVEDNIGNSLGLHSLLTIKDCYYGSKLTGKINYPVELFRSKIICDPAGLIGNAPTGATNVKIIGFDAVTTPYGNTKNGLILTGTAYTAGPANNSDAYVEGDVIVLTALIKAEAGSSPTMGILDGTSTNLDGEGGSFTLSGGTIPLNAAGKWYLYTYAITVPVGRSGNQLRFRFQAGIAGKTIQVASYGYQVIPQTNFITTNYSAKKRAKLTLWVPHIFDSAELASQKTHDWPDLITGSTQSTTITVTGAAVGDFAEASMSVSLSGTRIWAEVTAADTVTIYQRNDTGANVNVVSGVLRVRVRKQ